MWLRRSRLLPRATWAAIRVTTPVSTRITGRLSETLWTVPWQARRPDPRPVSPDASVDRVTVLLRRVDRDRQVTRDIRVETVGSGPAVLCVHGWGDDPRVFSQLALRLRDAGHTAVLVELPAHGTAPGVRTNGPEFAQVIHRVTSTTGAQRIVAHSLGAFATMIALRDGIDVSRVALLAPLVRVDDAVRGFVERARLSGRAEHGLRRRLEQRYGSALWDDMTLDAHAGRSTASALLVHDPDDRHAPFAATAALADQWPGAELITADGLGHRRLLTDPPTLDRVIGHVNAGASGDRDPR